MAWPDDPDAFLLAFHRAHPGVTTRAFSRGVAGDGRSSYEALADAAPPRGLVLDLGCGDGYLLGRLRARGVAAARLVGVDMSAAELGCARRRPALSGVALLCQRAQALPLRDGAVTGVLSHLAFMLMSDLPRVVAELARVLAPGGRFATVVGGGPRAGDAFELFLELFSARYAGQLARAPRLGDRRARSLEGLRALLPPEAGFAAVDVRDVTVSLDGTFDQVWQTLSTIYEMAVLPAPDRRALRQDFERAVAPLSRPDGTVPCTMAMSLATCERAS